MKYEIREQGTAVEIRVHDVGNREPELFQSFQGGYGGPSLDPGSPVSVYTGSSDKTPNGRHPSGVE